jgi:hypothetical protein
MTPEEQQLYAEALRGGESARGRYADWLRAGGRLAESEVWTRPEIDVQQFKRDICFAYAFYGALIDEAPNPNPNRQVQWWMQPVSHVFLAVEGEEFPIEGDQEGGASWLAAVLYEDDEPSPFLLIDTWYDELAGWIGARCRYDTLGELVEHLDSEQRRQFGLKSAHGH